LKFDAVFGFATCMAEDRAFIERKNKGDNGSYFVGYESAMPKLPGMVLLDATADIDGVSSLVSGRRHAKVPHVRYDKLQIVHVDSIVNGTFTRWWPKRQNQLDYIRELLDVTRRHVAVGQKALIVCMKSVAHADNLPNWSENVGRFAAGDTREFAWEFEGRHLAVTWWGGYGVGANDWRDAEVVLLFDDFHLPKRVLLATVQGLKGHTVTQGALAMFDDTQRKHDDVETLRTGHLQRWRKQMALRGQAREFDGNGICGEQKLVVISRDLVSLLKHRSKLFPGATLRVEESNGTHHHNVLERVVRYLMTPGLPNDVSTKEIGDMLGCEWRDVSSNLRKHKDWEMVNAEAGWSYQRGHGRAYGHFQRIIDDAQSNTA
jgi:hypothetical protein